MSIRAQSLRTAQQVFGNRAVQRAFGGRSRTLARDGAAVAVQRKDAGGTDGELAGMPRRLRVALDELAPQAMGDARPAHAPSKAATAISATSGLAPVQRYCGTPGCRNPECHDPRNHGFDRVYNLRAGPLYSYSVRASDLGKGTDTSKETRAYVNDRSQTSYPEEVRMSYSGGATGYTEFRNAGLKRGQKADAGHIRGRQNGGLGDDPAGVFPQNPEQNRGNKLDGQPTRDLWRAHEDAIHEGALDDIVKVAFMARDKPRKRYTSSGVLPDEASQF